jgi:carbon monoxide dehydrogenase subunit G
MRAFTFEEHIAASPERVWEVLTDLTTQSRWRPMIVSMRTEDGGPLRVGGKVELTAEVYGQRRERVSTTTALEPARRWTLHSSSDRSMEGWYEFRLEPQGTGTRVTATCDLKAHAFLPWLFLPMIARGERRLRVEMLANLKRVVEG